MNSHETGLVLSATSIRGKEPAANPNRWYTRENPLNTGKTPTRFEEERERSPHDKTQSQKKYLIIARELLKEDDPYREGHQFRGARRDSYLSEGPTDEMGDLRFFSEEGKLKAGPKVLSSHRP
ncbi:hypothetical protein Dsin_012424 [Dipteronia sinensis]|uniref:Uncharacterized protein n=1 Tax=Dipteronia sinensis TaxID=43782 RepID=A0AAE0E857_9ROSI|nr:hypothetical protein Dsin_012424 [Dipteronia sinensis]